MLLSCPLEQPARLPHPAQVLCTLVALHEAAVRLRLLRPGTTLVLGSGLKEIASVLALNSASLAIACRCGGTGALSDVL